MVISYLKWTYTLHQEWSLLNNIGMAHLWLKKCTTPHYLIKKCVKIILLNNLQDFCMIEKTQLINFCWPLTVVWGVRREKLQQWIAIDLSSQLRPHSHTSPFSNLNAPSFLLTIINTFFQSLFSCQFRVRIIKHVFTFDIQG